MYLAIGRPFWKPVADTFALDRAPIARFWPRGTLCARQAPRLKEDSDEARNFRHVVSAAGAAR
jgi:hypothetical protein